jgi:hypothetical protein
MAAYDDDGDGDVEGGLPMGENTSGNGIYDRRTIEQGPALGEQHTENEG